MKKQKQSTALVVQKKALPKAKVIRRNKSDEVIAMVMEEVETKLIEAELAGKVVDKLAYQVFDDKGNLLMQDLTYIGIRELSRQKMHIRISEPKETFFQDQNMWVVRVEAVNMDTQENAYGGAEISGQFKTSGKFNAFPYRSALVKAQRNAMKQLIPLSLRVKMFEGYLKSKEGRKQVLAVTINQQTIAENAPKAEKHGNLLKRIFIKIADMKLDKEKMHEYLKQQYETNHLSDLDEKKLAEIVDRLGKTEKDEARLKALKDKLSTVDVTGGAEPEEAKGGR